VSRVKVLQPQNVILRANMTSKRHALDVGCWNLFVF
jgi:hypothetical protein